MSSPPQIRTFRPDDLKAVRYQVGTSQMTPLTVANNKAYFHPLTLSVWAGLASVMIQLMDWWPTTDGPAGMWGLLSPLPALGAVAVPLMFLFDWQVLLHRPAFEAAVQKTLTAPDMIDPQAHYSRSPASGFYILENKDKPIGLIALDASPPSSDAASAGTRSSKTKPGATVDTATIRHFHVEDLYRVSEVQSDLLQYAVSRAFSASSSPRPRKVRAVSSALDVYKVAALRAAGFHPAWHGEGDEPQEWKVGVFGWKNRWVEVTREEWEAKRE